MEADAQRHTVFSRRELSNQIRAETLSWKSQSRRLAKRLLDGGDLNDNLIRSSLKSGYRRGWIWASLFGAQKNRQDLHHPIAKNSLPVFAGPQTTSVKCPDIQKLKQAGCHELRPCFGLPDLLVLLTLCRLFACEPSPIAWFFAFLLNFEDTGSLLKSFQWYPFSRSKWRCLAIASTNAGGTLSPCSVKNKHSGSGSPVAKINGTPAFSTKSRPAPITNMGLQ